MKRYQQVPDPYFENKNKSGTIILKITITVCIFILIFMFIRYGSEGAANGLLTREVKQKMNYFLGYYERYNGFDRMTVDIRKYSRKWGSEGDNDIHSFVVDYFKDPTGKEFTNVILYVYWNRFSHSISYIEVQGNKYGSCLECLRDENSSLAKKKRELEEDRKALKEKMRQERIEELYKYVSPSEGVRHLVGD